MYITKRDLDNLIEDLQAVQAEMEDHEIDELTTTCNTYGLYGRFISFGSDGYLDVDNALNDIYKKLEDGE